MAGWEQDDPGGLIAQLDANMLSLEGTNDLAVLTAYASPVGEQGTVNYLVLSYYTLDRAITGEDLETIMDTVNDLAKPLRTNLALEAEIRQNARIRHYGEYDALTVAYQVEYGETAAVIQIALVPSERTLFQIAYADFTTAQDDQTLEMILSSLAIAS